jgi:hypothetical protein
MWRRMPKWFRWFINRIDDPWDNVVQKLNGMHLPFGYQLWLGCIMKNRDYGCSIRKR